MTRHIYIAIGLLYLILTGCVSENLKNAAIEAASVIQAKTYAVSTGGKSLNIEFSNFEDLSDNPDTKTLSSTAAILFFKNLKLTDYEDVSNIKVTLMINNKTVETFYDIKQLTEAEKYFNVTSRMISAYQHKSFEAMVACMDTTYIPIERQADIFKEMITIESLHGPIKGYTYLGFAFNKKQELEKPVFVALCVLEQDSVVTTMKFAVDTGTNKIIFISINGKE